MSDMDITTMGDAGKAMPVPCGQYSDTETYDYLDFVYSGDASYIAKKLTTGNPPAEDNEFWQLLARGGTLTKNSDISDTTVTFEAAKERINIFSTDSLKVIMGKIKKWFTDLKPVAFSGKYSDLDATGYITTLTNFSQINNTYRHWKIAEIDSTYASQLGIERNTGDFNVLVLDYNGDGITFNYGNMILASPRLGNDHYLVQMWRAEALVTYHRGNVPALTNNLLATIAGTALDAVQGKILNDKITQLNSDLQKWHKSVKWFADSGGLNYVIFSASELGLTAFPEYMYIAATARYTKTNQNNEIYVTGIYYEALGVELKVFLNNKFSGGLYINLIYNAG